MIQTKLEKWVNGITQIADLFGGGKGAVCLHTGKKNINEKED